MKETQSSFNVAEISAWKKALVSCPQRPVLVHVNADTTWLLQIPCVHKGRTRYNVLFDPWLAGPQYDVASWFSIQWHVVAPVFQTISELNDALRGSEVRGERCSAGESEECFIDLVVVAHEFTDHCHKQTLEQVPASVPVIATDKAAALIMSWHHFTSVSTPPMYKSELVPVRSDIPPWLRVFRIASQGNALYYHSAIVLEFDVSSSMVTQDAIQSRSKSEAVVYSPHGISGVDLAALPSAGIRTLALLHGMHEIQLAYMKQLNLGALNGINAARVCNAKYWLPTHDEVKQGGGVVSWFLNRTQYTLHDALLHSSQGASTGELVESGDVGCQFVDLCSGDAFILS
ncbi:hypothetical protein DIPPA_70147 [Diplonema papillatum]|nr:hypothetical protein DIPPA_70147 [Diplonema papillatum]